MNLQRRKSAVTKYSPLLANKTREEIMEALAGDDKGYTADEINEIIEEIYSGSSNTSVPATTGTLNKNYEEWKVEPVKESILSCRKEGKEFNDSCFSKAGATAVRVTSITPERAALLNTQSENTGLRLYEVAV